MTTCVVPEGMAIYLAPVSSECSTVEPEPYFGRDEADLRACATENGDLVAEVTVGIDGVDVGDLSGYRTQSPLFTLNFPEDNYFEVPPGVALLLADGYSVIIAPPPPGEYEISFTVTDTDGSVPFAGTVRVRVVAPAVIEPGATPEATPTT